MKVLLVGEGPNELDGALETLVRRLGLADAEIDTDQVKCSDIHAHHGKGQGYFKRAVRWILEAKKRGYDALVLVIDRDNRPERLQEFERAQQQYPPAIRRALGVAIRTFDAWMLADERALTKVLGCAVSRQQNPETIAKPKDLIREILDTSDQSMATSEAYAAIANLVDMHVLETRCKRGFAPFAGRVREL